MADQTFWADPQTAPLVRIELELSDGSGHGVISHFRYAMDLDPSLFSLQPPRPLRAEGIQATTEEVQADAKATARLQARRGIGLTPIKCHSILGLLFLGDIRLADH